MKALPWLLAASLLVLVIAVFAATPITEHIAGYDSDGAVYGAMAGAPEIDPQLGRQAPLCYRIITPWLAGQLPWPTLTNFRVLAFISSLLNLFLLTLILRRLGFGTLLTGFGSLLYALDFWTLRFSAYAPAYIDFQTMTFLLSATLLSLQRRWMLLALVYGVGTLQKESMAAFLPFSLFLLWSGREGAAMARPAAPSPRIRSRQILLSLALVSSAGAGFFLPRLLIEPSNDYSLMIWFDNVRRLADPDFWPRILHALLSGAGLLPALAFLRPAATRQLVREHGEWAIWLLLSAALLFAGNDKARLVLLALPALIIVAVHGSRRFVAPLDGPRAALWMVGTLLLHAWIGHYFSGLDDFDAYLDRMVPAHASPGHRLWLLRDLFAVGFWILFTLLISRVRRPRASPRHA